MTCEFVELDVAPDVSSHVEQQRIASNVVEQ